MTAGEDISPETIEKASALWEDYEHRFDELEEQKYDGAAGLPPNWIPPATVWRFKQTRNYFLEDCGYTPEVLTERIDYYCEEGVPPFRVHPNKTPVDRGALNLLLGFLANLRWVVSLGQSKGLMELASIDAANTALGKDRRDKLKAFARIHAEELHDEREKEWLQWQKESDRLTKKNLSLRGNKSELARRIKKNLDLPDTVRTIRNRI